MPFNSDFIKEIAIKGNILEGMIFLPALNKQLAIEIDPEEDATVLADFEELITVLREFVDYLSPERFQQMQRAISRELTESAYEQDDYQPVESDFAGLEQDLSLVKITAFPEGFLLDYNAPVTYPGNQIKVQLDETFNIEDLAIYD